MPSTPKQKAVETKSSSSKMRQLSLMSFFKPEKPQSSPLLSKQTYPIIKDEVKESKKVVYHDSDKENDADISIELPSHETPPIFHRNCFLRNRHQFPPSRLFSPLTSLNAHRRVPVHYPSADVREKAPVMPNPTTKT